MAAFDPKTEYSIVPDIFPIQDFHVFADAFVVRPPYQRKNVWSRKKQQALLDSLFRRYYVPRIVIRQVRLDKDRTVNEVIDGQQRINTVQQFLADRLPLPTSLEDLDQDLAGKRYSDLPVEMRQFVVRRLRYDADIVIGIDDPRNPAHQKIAAEIFWRLQQGESLNYMEVAHSRLSSLARNFVVKYADDIRFDYDSYRPVDSNPDKHPFFRVIKRSNVRMQQMALLTRLLILEENGGPADIRDVNIMEYIDNYQRPDGIANWSMEEEEPHARQVLRNLRLFHETFKDDSMIDESSGMKEFSIEYFIISTYLLLRHLSKYYVFDKAERALLHDFVVEFHQRWRSRHNDDTDILIFSDNRQQTSSEIEVRHRIIRQLFFEYAAEKDHHMLRKDTRRRFNEAERIRIYRRDRGLCQEHLAEGKSEEESRVSWSNFEADHIIPHAKGGDTAVWNGQVLCRYHNARKGANL
jgi:hypothetical protein